MKVQNFYLCIIIPLWSVVLWSAFSSNICVTLNTSPMLPLLRNRMIHPMTPSTFMQVTTLNCSRTWHSHDITVLRDQVEIPLAKYGNAVWVILTLFNPSCHWPLTRFGSWGVISNDVNINPSIHNHPHKEWNTPLEYQLFSCSTAPTWEERWAFICLCQY